MEYITFAYGIKEMFEYHKDLFEFCNEGWHSANTFKVRVRINLIKLRVVVARYAVKDSISPFSLPISSIGNGEITTIESLSEDENHPLQQTWLKYDVAQSSYRRAGQIMSSAALLKSDANPSDEEIEATMNENLCRCGTYLRIRKAIKTATNT